MLRRLQKINHVEHTSACAFAPANLDTVRHGTKRRNNAAFLHHSFPPPQSSICRRADELGSNCVDWVELGLGGQLEPNFARLLAWHAQKIA